mmetsp:Transcript_30770/g.57664  ORF Transcript_30770/g.57664 Transcript_30770/m.57664 type:complete len:324 (-) Transcript_30770:242-1213(-)
MMSWMEFVVFESTDDFGTIFSRPCSACGCLLFTITWAILRKALQPKALSKSPPLDPEGLARRFYIGKLRRMICYCTAASAGGVILFIQSILAEAPTKSMLMGFGAAHQVLFWMAMGHWSIALWEDWRTRLFLGQGLKVDSGGGLALFPLNLCCTPVQVMYGMYTLHHIATLLAYAYALWTYELAGVMVQGLMFELPVVFMLRRELGLAQDVLPEWLTQPWHARMHWRITYFAFLAGRGPAEGLWIISMLPLPYGRTMLEQTVSSQGLVVYHLLALFFTSLNIRILGLLFCWHAQDVSRAESLQEKLQRELEINQHATHYISKE